jgi:hypothetical protein
MTTFDKIIERLKNNKIIAILLVCFAILVGTGQLADIWLKTKDIFDAKPKIEFVKISGKVFEKNTMYFLKNVDVSIDELGAVQISRTDDKGYYELTVSKEAIKRNKLTLLTVRASCNCELYDKGTNKFSIEEEKSEFIGIDVVLNKLEKKSDEGILDGTPDVIINATNGSKVNANIGKGTQKVN